MVKKSKSPSRPVGTVAVRLDLMPADRDRLRILAAHEGLSMSAYARQIVEREIQAAGKKNSR